MEGEGELVSYTFHDESRRGAVRGREDLVHACSLREQARGGKEEGKLGAHLFYDGAGVQAGSGDDAAAKARVDQLMQPLRGDAAAPAPLGRCPPGLVASRGASRVRRSCLLLRLSFARGRYSRGGGRRRYIQGNIRRRCRRGCS